MKRWIFCSILILALGFGALGCGGGKAPTTITIAISPTTISVITNTSTNPPFSAFVSGSSDQAVTWTVTCPTGVTAPACGTIDANGVYTAPKTVPTVTTNGTLTIVPTATVTATAHADTTKTASARVTIISGISISITPSTATVGTLEHFAFLATVNNPGCVNTPGNTDCQDVTWSVPTTAGVGSILATPGASDNATYTAPAAASTVPITATSVKDPAVTATALVTVVTKTTPTVTSVSPNTAAVGSLFQDIYVTGTSFISTNDVYVDNNKISGAGPDSLPLVSVISPSLIRARIPDSLLTSPGTLTVSVAQQSGGKIGCANGLSPCQIVLTAARPAITGPSPDNIQQNNGALSFNVNGGFFGTTNNPSVTATFDGNIQLPQITNARQLSLNVAAGSVTVPGLHPVAIISNADATKIAVTNVAVQPNYNSGGGSTISTTATVQLPVGSAPSDVAVDPAIGVAVVANVANTAADSDSISIIDLKPNVPGLGVSLCIDAPGAKTPPCTTQTGPKSIAIDYIKDRAYVLNSTTQTVAVVDLNSKTVLSVIQLFQNPLADAPQHPPTAIGINPITHRALVTIKNRSYGLLLDTTQSAPTVLGPVSISTGADSRVAVEPHLNWAITTPGGIGSIGIVDLNRQTQNTITSISRLTNVVTVTVQASSATLPQPPLAVHFGDTVFIQGVSDASFNGFYSVTGLGPQSGQFSYTQSATGTLPDKPSFNTAGTVNYAASVATLASSTTVQGVAVNPETQQAVLVDPSPNSISAGRVLFLSLLDQTPTSVTLSGTTAVEIGSVAAAFNPLTNVAVTVNPGISNLSPGTLSVIDPSAPKRLNTTPFFTGKGPIAVAVDPAKNLAVVANQTDNTVSVVSLGTAFRPLTIVESSPKEFVVNSTLGSVASPGVVNPLTIIGSGFTSTSVVRLDGVGLTPTSVTDREITVVVPPALLTSARRFALDVLNSNGMVSNATDFTVEQSVDVSTGSCTAPLPAGVAIDPVLNLAAVTLSGCGTVALIDISNDALTGTGAQILLGANTNPIGVAVLTRLHKAVVANSRNGNASIVDELAGTATSVTAGQGPVSVATDQDTGEAAVANSGANTVSIVNLASSGVTSISTGQHPVAVAFDYLTRQVAAAADASNSVGIATAPSGSLAASFPISVPTAAAYDPSTNAFLIASGTNNSVTLYDPTTQQQTGFFRVGLNPTAIAYNYLTGTLITTNTGSHTITVADILSNRIRAVLTLPSPPTSENALAPFQFAVDIHPLTNIAVIADTANGRVLIVPVPR